MHCKWLLVVWCALIGVDTRASGQPADHLLLPQISYFNHSSEKQILTISQLEAHFLLVSIISSPDTQRLTNLEFSEKHDKTLFASLPSLLLRLAF